MQGPPIYSEDIHASSTTRNANSRDSLEGTGMRIVDNSSERPSKMTRPAPLHIYSGFVGFGNLITKVGKYKLIFDNSSMPPEHMGNYLRSHRRMSGLTQRELASIVGFLTRFQIARHEESRAVPVFLVAISYEIVFRAPISELFPGLYRSVEARIEEQLAQLEQALQESTAKGRKAAFIARKLEWLWARRNAETV